MTMTAGGCYHVDAAQVRRVEEPATAVGLARWRERRDDLVGTTYALIHEDRHLSVDEIRAYHAMRSELRDVEAAIAGLEAGAPASSREVPPRA